MFKVLVATAALAALAAWPQDGVPARSQPSAVTVEDLAVIDAALDHKTRDAINLARPRGLVLLLDQTLEPCAVERGGANCFNHGEKTAAFVQQRIREVTKARLDTLVARNVRAQRLPSAPAKDVMLVAKDKLAAVMKQHDANVVASASLPAYFDDGTALIFLGFHCGGLCGEGNFILLRRDDDGWEVVKAAITWIS